MGSIRLAAASLAMVLAIGCGGGDGPADPDGGGHDAAAPADAGPDPSDQLFRPGHVLEVNITLAASDWAILRAQPDQLGLPQVTCASQPTDEPYTTFPADITIDDLTVTDVGLRKKGGYGSISSERPGLKVDVAQYVADQKIFGLKHLTLNNNKQDPSYISQCLGYELFAQAGLPSSRCSFAHVTVNGEDLGIYSNVETIKDSYLRRNFGNDSGRLYESGGDFAPGQTAYFQPKSGATPPDCSDLDPVVTALDAPDDQLVAQLGAVVNLDEFSRYWAMEVLTDHWDGYANNRNNFYFYDDPTTGINFLPWGIDSLFTVRARTTRPDSVFACGSMPWRLYDAPATRAMYLASLRDLLGTVWNEDAILAEIDRMQTLLEPRIDPTGTGAFAHELDKVRTFVTTRRAALESELDAGDPVWPYPEGEPSCRISLGNLSATFSTTWGTLDQFGVGSGSMDGTIAGVSLTSSTVSSIAGFDSDGKATIELFNLLPDGRYAVIFAIVENAGGVTPGTYSIDLANVAAFMTFYDPQTDTTSGGGLILPGSFTLTSGSTVQDAPISGSLSGEVIEL